MEKNRVAEIEQAAAETLANFGFYPEERSTASLDIIHIANSLGFSVYTGELPMGKDALVVVQGRPVPIFDEKNNGKVIAVNEARGMPFKRFLIAHGLGHIILEHYSKYLPFRHCEDKERDAADDEADYFAAALLMPKEMFVRDYQQLEILEDRFLNLAREYRVRVSDARFRAEMLGLK